MSRCYDYDNTNDAVKEAHGNNARNSQNSHTQNVRELLASSRLDNHELHRSGLHPPPYYTHVTL